jgi:hypothetical protein
MVVLFCLSFTSCSVLAVLCIFPVLFCLSCPPVLFRLSCSAFLVLPFLSAYPTLPGMSVLFCSVVEPELEPQGAGTFGRSRLELEPVY